MTDSYYRRISHLQHWNQKISGVSDRFSTYRFIAFAVGVLATWIVFQFVGDAWGWVTLAISIIGFLIVVWRHQSVDRYVKLSEARLDIEKVQFARHTLDWETIPEPQLHIADKDPMQVDLDLVGHRSLHHLIDNSLSDAG
nr:hypothetical protein [candidate division Zixibacteria bacterium]NIR67287.1 hypothetical protein [candidate division Zixibacteria bacterium]NIW48248.1 hypothetical protein [Gammaproteobacteria bacterium]